MHTLTNAQPIDLGKSLGILAPGEWLMSDLNAFEIAMRGERGTVKIRQDGWKDLTVPNGGTLIMRSGAIGDLLMLTPAVAAMKKRPSISVFDTHKSLFTGLDIFDRIETYPLPLAHVARYSRIISLEDTMETDHSQHATDVFAKALGLETPLPSYKPLYEVTEFEKEAAKKWTFGNRPNIAIQPRASIPNRDYPAQLWGEVITRLEKRGWGILIFGRKGQIPELPPELQTPFIRNLAQEELPLRESVAVLSQCDAFCGVDSSFMHFAGALGIPSVSLHGPFRWQTRTAHYPLNTALTGNGECAGCSWHMHNGRMFPPNKPCSTRGLCVVLADIKPERIVARIDLLKP